MVTSLRIALLGFALVCTGAIAGDAAVDLVVVSGAIYTADAQQREVQAFAVRGDVIEAVGSNEDIMALAGEATTVLDLDGRRVLPGLHDTHIHPLGIVKYDGCNLNSEAMNLQELADFVAACVERQGLVESAWLAVRQWNFSENNRPAGELANIRQALDAGAPDNPVMLLGNDGHHQGTNSLGLALARNAAGEQVGLSAKTLAADFQAYRHYVGVDETGEPNGAVNESSVELLGGPSILTADLDLIAAEAHQVPKRLNSLGITAIQEAAYMPELIPFYSKMSSVESELPLRIRLAQFLPPQLFTSEQGELDMDALLTAAATIRDLYRDQPNINANALKLFADGVMEGNPLEVPPTLPNAAALRNYHQPLVGLDSETGEVGLRGYVDLQGEACAGWAGDATQTDGFMQRHGFHPGQCRSENGVLAAPREHILEFLAAADAAGYAVHIHAIGDRAVRTAVDAIAQVTEADVTTNPHSMAHLQLVADEELKRIGELKIPLAMTYAWAVKNPEYDMTVIPFIEKLDGPEDMYDPDSYYYQHFYPVVSIQQAGGVLAAGSDAPVESDDPRPFLNIQAAVTRDRGQGSFNPAQRLAILDAIDAYTINGARLMNQSDLTGSIEPGKKADFIVLNQDIVKLHANDQSSKIGQTQVLQTWFDGRQVYGDQSL
ncbi:MAG: amidohydrolase family protein [Halioglobus sp.]